MATVNRLTKYQGRTSTSRELVMAVDTDTPHIKQFDWPELVPTRKGSCLNLSSVEPCVNKAVYCLGVLKTQLEQCNRRAAREKEKRESLAKTPHSEIHTEREDDRRTVSQSSRPLTSKSTSSRVSQLSSIAIQNPRDLCIEGTSTGTEVERARRSQVLQPQQVGGDWLALDVIAGAINLVVRLEEDRQETLGSLSGERVKVQQLGTALDAEAEGRLNLLGTVVQKEHEECLRDILELKWHVSYEGRQLSRIKDNLRITAEKNAELQKDVGYLSENCPLLEEKMAIESDNISQVAQQQQETSDQLSQAKQRLIQCEDRSHQVHSQARAEKLQMEQSLNDIRDKLKAVSDQLLKARGELTAVTHKMNNAHKNIALHQKQSNNCDERRGQCRIQQSEIESRVSYLRDDHARLEVAHREKEEENARLKEREEAAHSSLESEHVAVLSSLQGEERALRDGRERNEEMNQDIDTHREQIAASLKQTADDEKSVERARRELVRLDQQLQVSMERYERVREENARMEEQLKGEEVKAGDMEHSLKSTIETLQQQLKEETKTKVTYEGKVKADMVELEKLRTEGRKKTERAERLATETEKQSKGCSDVVSELENTHAERQRTLESLHSELAAVLEEHASCERELGGRRGELVTREQQLRAEVQEKVTAVDSVMERTKQLERKVEDVVKSTAMVQKMERSTNNAIEELESELGVLKERLAAERKDEQSWRDEFQEISEFSSDADERHKTYLREREELLKQSKSGLHEALSRNVSLAVRHHQLQSQFIATKTTALRVLGRKLDLEASLRDHKQLLAFQSQIYSTMRSYYEHRGVCIRRDLAEFHDHSRLNIQQLKSLQAQLDEAVTQMNAFLETGLQMRTSIKKTVRIQE